MTTQNIELLASDSFQILRYLESSIKRLEDLLAVATSVTVITVTNEEDNTEKYETELDSSLNVEACLEAQELVRRVSSKADALQNRVNSLYNIIQEMNVKS